MGEGLQRWTPSRFATPHPIERYGPNISAFTRCSHCRTTGYDGYSMRHGIKSLGPCEHGVVSHVRV
jgi:hypothetical protein